MAAPNFNGLVTPPTMFRPEAFGAKGDVRTFYDAHTTNGSAVLTSNEANFTNADIGKSVCVTDGLGYANPLIGTVVSVQSATQCTMSIAATNTITGNNQASVGTDDTTAIQNTINAGVATGKSFTVLFSSMYLVNGALGGSHGENSILRLPSVNVNTGAQIIVSLVGAQPPGMIVDGVGTSSQPPTSVTAGLISYNSAPSSVNFSSAPARLLWNCSLTAGSQTLTCNNANFTSADIGKTIGIPGAWISGNGATGDLICTITGVTNSTTCTISVPAVTTMPSSVYTGLGIGSIIGVRGPTSPWGTWQGGSTPTFADTQTYDSLFGSGNCPFSNIVVQVKDLAILNCAHPALSGLDLRFAQGAMLDNVLVSTARWITTGDDDKGHDAPSQFGIALPAAGNQAMVYVGNVACYGQYNALVASGLTQINQFSVGQCNQGLTVWSVAHDIHIGRLLTQYCPTGIGWYSSSGAIFIDNHDYEHLSSGTIDFYDGGRAVAYGDTSGNGTASGYINTFGANTATGITTGYNTNYGSGGQAQRVNFMIRDFGYYNKGSTPPTIRKSVAAQVGGVNVVGGTGVPSGAATLATYYHRADPSGALTYVYFNAGGGSTTWTGIV